ncbi:hypothetical protein ASG29_14285 [Sphingomonas sp. Leaf412]|nr:hypothetical protein ASG29_14285 [Sphingomonas sp. Leaf412]
MSPSRRLAAVVFAAYRNERALDIHYRRLNHECNESLGRLPNYKPMALLAFRRRFGGLTYVALIAAAFAIAAWNIIGLIRLVAPRRRLVAPAYMVATVASNRVLIRNAIAQAPESSGAAGGVDLDRTTLIRGLGLRQRFVVIVAMLRLYRAVMGCSACRLDLGLHTRDAFDILLLACFADEADGTIIWTDDHYQRWAFILSRARCRLRVAQHGFFDDGIAFPEPFGAIDLLGVRSQRFVGMFERYFDVRASFVFGTSTDLDDLGRGPILILASSAPHIADEIALLERLRGRIDLPIAIKLHPAHRYDARREQLLALADIVCTADQRPAARLFVSWNSFMEFDYESAGIPTCSIARCGGAEQAAAQIIERLRPAA